jgi:hypothetical protein
MSWITRQLKKPLEQQLKLLAYVLGIVILVYVIIILHDTAFPTPDKPSWAK